MEKKIQDLLKLKLVIGIAVVVLVLGMLYAVLDGVVNIVEDTITDIKQKIKTLSTASGNEMYCYEVEESAVEGLKQNLEEKGIGTDASELTSITLKKMIMAYFLSSYTSDSLIVASITEEEIDLIKEKYETITEGTAKWDSNITIYKLTETFFYFKDNGSLSSDNSTNGKWYLGAYGIIKIENMSYMNYSTYESEANAYIASYPNGDANFLEKYSIDSNGNIIYFDIEETESSKYIEFSATKEDDEEIFFETVSAPGTSSAQIGGTTKKSISDLLGNAGISEYAIQIELLIDLLEVSGSMDFVDTFIDFATDKTGISISLTPVKNGGTTYSINSYEIADDFILEVYDFNDVTHFQAYKNLVLPVGTNYNRTYQKSDSETITFNNSVYEMIVEEGLELKDIDYDPGVEEILGSIDEYMVLTFEKEESDLKQILVNEISQDTKTTIARELSITGVSTWYGSKTYEVGDTSNLVTEYYCNGSTISADEYNNIDTKELFNGITGEPAGEDEEDSLIYVTDEYALAETITESSEKIIKVSNTDLYDEELGNYVSDNKENYGVEQAFAIKKFITYGLANVSMLDDGDENSSMGATMGSDYIYTRYKKTNKLNYTCTTNFMEKVDKNSITSTGGTFKDENLYELLALLCNAAGTKEGASAGFVSRENGGIVVRYDDMYNSTAKVGDLLLDNGALMLFDLLDASSNTQKLTNVFKYLAYLYSGIDYGITSSDQLEDLFAEFNLVSGSSGYWWPVGGTQLTDSEGNAVTDEEAKSLDKVFAKGEPETVYISSDYGYRGSEFHPAIDIAGGDSTVYIVASKSGTVVKTAKGFTDNSSNRNKVPRGTMESYGNYVIIQHGDGSYTLYAHLYPGSVKVSEGDTVSQGQVIGRMGSTGNSTGQHLHFEIRIGGNTGDNRVNPNEHVSSGNPRPASSTSSSTLLEWLKNIEGGSQYINGDTWAIFDPEGNDNTMNLAYGMVVADYNGASSWYPSIIPGNIYAGDTVTEAQAMEIMEIKHKSFYDAIDSACSKYGVTLESYQRDAVFSMIYRLGSSRASNIIGAYSTGSYEGLWNYIKNTYHASYPTGTKIRLAEEYELFCTGDYNYDPGTYSTPIKYNNYCTDSSKVFQ